MKTITSGDVIRACKKENGIRDLMEKFGYATQDDLFNAIKNIFPVACDSFIRNLKKTGKKSKTSSVDMEKTQEQISEIKGDTELEEVTETMEKIADNLIPSELIIDETNSENLSLENSEVEAPQNNEVELHENDDIKDTETELEALKAKEAKLSEEVIGFEVTYKKWCDKKNEELHKLSNAKKALEELKKILSFQENNVLNLSKSFSECENAIEEINTKKAKVSAELYEVRCKIANLQKITILVYKDGTLCIENADTPDISEYEYTKNLSKFFEIPAAGKLTLDEIKGLAKLLEIIKYYQEDKRECDIIFDNPIAQQIWEGW